jgi:hypothetical protein
MPNNAERTHCHRGHEFATHAYVYTDHKGSRRICRTCAKERHEKRYDPKEYLAKPNREAYLKKMRETAKRLYESDRAAALEAYGKHCQCCKEKRKIFLCIDHIDGRKKWNHGRAMSSSPFYRWLRNNNYPKGFQVLCHNCNYAKAHGGCPHQGGDAK